MRSKVCALIVGITCLPSVVVAQVIITEVMYDLKEGSDTGREWIEIYNSGSSISISTLRLFENGVKHTIKGVTGNDLPAGAYAVITDRPERFKTDHPSFSGILFDSTFSLNNSGESIALVDATGREIDHFTYTNALGGSHGNSLQRISLNDMSFASGEPTPGVATPSGGPVRLEQEDIQIQKKEQPVQKSDVAIIGESEARVSPTLTSTHTTSHPYTWFYGVLCIAGIAAFAALNGNQAPEDEWTIIEETPLTG